MGERESEERVREVEVGRESGRSKSGKRERSESEQRE